MKIVRRLFLALIGFAGAFAFMYYADPQALDAVGFVAFYVLLAIGFCNLFLLFGLTVVQSLLLALLFLAFLILRQLHLFSFWLGLLLVLGVIFIERYAR